MVPYNPTAVDVLEASKASIKKEGSPLEGRSLEEANLSQKDAMGPRPKRPFFSSGPCVKPKGWSGAFLEGALLGRSHRSPQGVASLCHVTESLRALLEIPPTHRIGLTPGSATGAMEMALWNFLRPERPVDLLEWDVFSAVWAYSIQGQLRVPMRRIRGSVPEVFQEFSPHHDGVLTWCGTTHGVWVGEHGNFLDSRGQGEGLVIADAASAVLTTHIPWKKLDITTFSWQKGLGGEAGLGVMVVGPRAWERLQNSSPPWPIPRLLRLKDEGGEVMPGIFQGEMINTCSMLLVQEYASLLELWHERGGLSQALGQTQENFQALENWCRNHPFLDFAVSYAPCRAQGPVVLSVKDPRFQALALGDQWNVLKKLGAFLAENQGGFDIVNHARAFPSLRIWCGPTVEIQDLEGLFPWIDTGLQEVFQRF